LDAAAGRVVAISISREKGTPKQNVSMAVLVEDWGIEGDAHAGRWRRQVSLLPLESIESMREKGLNLRPGAFGENITVQSVDVRGLRSGDRILIGDAELEVTQVGKECRAKCAIYERVGDCIMPREGIFATVRRGGKVTVGDPVEVVRRDGSGGSVGQLGTESRGR